MTTEEDLPAGFAITWVFICTAGFAAAFLLGYHLLPVWAQGLYEAIGIDNPNILLVLQACGWAAVALVLGILQGMMILKVLPNLSIIFFATFTGLAGFAVAIAAEFLPDGLVAAAGAGPGAGGAEEATGAADNFLAAYVMGRVAQIVAFAAIVALIQSAILFSEAYGALAWVLWSVAAGIVGGAAAMLAPVAIHSLLMPVMLARAMRDPMAAPPDVTEMMAAYSLAIGAAYGIVYGLLTYRAVGGMTPKWKE